MIIYLGIPEDNQVCINTMNPTSCPNRVYNSREILSIIV